YPRVSRDQLRRIRVPDGACSQDRGARVPAFRARPRRNPDRHLRAVRRRRARRLRGRARPLVTQSRAMSHEQPSTLARYLFIAYTAGGVLGALAAAAASRRLLHEEGLKAIRDRLFLSGSGIDLGLVLLGLWLIAQLNPGMLLFGTGDLRELFRPPPGKLYPAELFVRVEAGVAGANALCVGLLASCLVARG